MSTEEIWFNNMSILFDTSKLLVIIPDNTMTLNEKINSLTRFILYLSLLLTILKQNYLYLYIFIVPVIISYIVYMFLYNSKEFFKQEKTKMNSNLDNLNNQDNHDNRDNLNNQNNNKNNSIDFNSIMEDALNDNCVLPSSENPVMNVMPTDNFQQRRAACNISDKKIADLVSNEINDTYREKLYNDSTSIFNNRISERSFYTMPNSSVPNDQGTFAKWLYNTPVACKLGNTGTLKQVRSCAFNSKSLDELKKEKRNRCLELEKISA